MDEWYSLTNTMFDESEDPHKTREFTRRVLQDIRRMKLKDRGKFENRMGPEFDGWAAGLVHKYGEPLVKEILNDEEFWRLTLSLRRG